MTIRVSIVGDDFTPSSMLASTVRERTGGEGIVVSLADLDGARFQKERVDGIAEYLGEPADMSKLIEDAEVLLTTFGPVNDSVLRSAPALELIVCGRGGPVNIDMDATSKRGVEVLTCPGRNVDAVAEYVIGLLIGLARRIPNADRWVREGSWVSGQEDTLAKPTGPELHGRTLGVIGYGAIGSKVASLGHALGMKVIVTDPFIDQHGPEVAAVELSTLLSESDFVTVHARPSGDGHAIIGHHEVAGMKEGVYVVNTSRGANVDEAALLTGLESGRIAGVALDVLSLEPIDEAHPLLEREDVILTPHAAGVSTDIPRRTAAMMAEQLAGWLGGP